MANKAQATSDHKAFDQAIDLPVARQPKPRETGLNFSGDWGIGLEYQQDLLEAMGEYVDLVKTAVLSARLSSREFIQRKIELYNRYQVKVFPGGMTLEAALVCKKVPAFFDEARELVRFGDHAARFARRPLLRIHHAVDRDLG